VDTPSKLLTGMEYW